MKAKKLWVGIIIILLLVGGGFLLYKVFATKSSQPNPDNSPPENPDGKLSQQELEKYLLEKRLDLQKYFVFNLGKEVKQGNNVFLSDGRYVSNGRNLVTSLEKHLTRLLGAEKNWIAFKGKYTNEIDPEWREDKLDEKISNGKEWYIFFDKTKINEETCNFFEKTAGIPGITRTFPASCVLAVESEDGVWIKKSKPEALEFLKTDPALEGKV